MHQNENDKFPLQSTSTAPGLSQTGFVAAKSRTSLVRVQNQRLRVMDERADYTKFRKQSPSCDSKVDIRFHSRSGEDARDESKGIKKTVRGSEERVFSSPDFVVNDCWKTTSGEIPVKLIHLFKENKLEENQEEEDSDVPVKKRRLALEDENEKLSYTKEFHVLTEVQKARILTAVEDAIKRLANRDMKDYSQGFQDSSHENMIFSPAEHMSTDKFYKKFLLPWLIVKVIEMVLCHIIQLTFLSEETYFQRKNEFLPVVVTYYLTLFIVVFSLVIHISCFNYSGIRNPCYFMGVISSSILTLTTTLGILVMLTSMEYYKSSRQILVLTFIGTLLCSLFAELCLCYFEVKNIWNTVGQTEQYYLA